MSASARRRADRQQAEHEHAEHEGGGADRGLKALVPLLAQEPSLSALLGRLDASLAVCEPARALVLAGLSAVSQRCPLLVAVPTHSEAGRLADSLAALLGSDEVEEMPEWGTLPFERVSPSVSAMGRRMRVLHRLTDPGPSAPAVIVASARALTQRLDAAAVAAPITLSLGDVVDQSALIEKLAGLGYRREHQVEHRGEMAVRGSIVDVYPSTGPAPVRIDFWGDEIDRLAEFSADDQRTTAALETVEVFACRELRPNRSVRRRAAEIASSEPPAGSHWDGEFWQRIADGEMFDGMESAWPQLAQRPVTLPELLPPGAAMVMIEPRRIKDRAADVLSEERELASVVTGASADDAGRLPRLHAGLEEARPSTGVPVWAMPSVPSSPDDPVVDATGWAGGQRGLKSRARRIAGLLDDGYKVVLCARGAGTADRLSDLLADHGARLSEPPAADDLHRGAVLNGVKLAVLASSDITGRRRAVRRRHPRSSNGRDARRFFEGLSPGSFVVHHRHGIGRFEGMVRRSVGGSEREYLLLAYRGRDRLYVPTDQVDSVRRYTGGATPRLSRMGGSDWAAAKVRVRRQVAEVAKDLVALYQKRITAPGHAFDGDSVWQREMEDSFEYRETRDQLRVLAEVKHDMEQPTPMDRLLVGDVGFGKTEVALRAVFKAVLDGRQAAVLAPTTLLAHQHTRTLRGRFVPFGARVEMLSRFLTPAEAAEVIRGVASGEVDVVVGTHRMLSPDVNFRRLGLLVIDEEQRFGVRHKEAIKELRSEVDVLTLTATPVPRTLEMSLTGIRDISLLRTPPVNRRPILTYVGEFKERAVAEAVRRELLREGQVFYVHNRVADIHRVARRLRRLVPEARVAVAHGQMEESSLERTVLDFSEQCYDVLVCTTIIESGIDMPTVNTLIVDRADRLGLGQLHQIRGRVGRSGHRAYAYLFYPAGSVLSEQAYDRLKTIGEATALGSGYRIAMRDLEIRGAGNLLGEAQSGHIAAVGYDLYCQLVSEAVAELRGERPEEPQQVTIEVPVDAHIPGDYMEGEASRLEAYQRLAEVSGHAELDDVREEWLDRFGPLPASVEALLEIGRLRVDCLRAGVTQVTVIRAGGAVGGLSRPSYRARLSPVRLPASRQVRLRRLYGDGAVNKRAVSELHVPLRASEESVTAQLRRLIEQILSPARPGSAAGVRQAIGARGGGAGARGAVGGRSSAASWRG